MFDLYFFFVVVVLPKSHLLTWRRDLWHCWGDQEFLALILRSCNVANLCTVSVSEPRLGPWSLTCTNRHSQWVRHTRQHIELNNHFDPALSLLRWDGKRQWQVNKGDAIWSFCYQRGWHPPSFSRKLPFAFMPLK